MNWRKILPLIVFGLLFMALLRGLGLNPRQIPSVLIDQPMPNTTLPALSGDGIGFSTEELTQTDELKIVNFFASWCVPCRVEHPALMRLKKLGYKIYGIAYKDDRTNINSFITNLGNPYEQVGMDNNGRAGVNWGVYGVPETFIIYKSKIIYKHMGPIHETDMEAIEKLLSDVDQKG